jgi:hypothetical protein
MHVRRLAIASALLAACASFGSGSDDAVTPDASTSPPPPPAPPSDAASEDVQAPAVESPCKTSSSWSWCDDFDVNVTSIDTVFSVWPATRDKAGVTLVPGLTKPNAVRTESTYIARLGYGHAAGQKVQVQFDFRAETLGARSQIMSLDDADITDSGVAMPLGGLSISIDEVGQLSIFTTGKSNVNVGPRLEKGSWHAIALDAVYDAATNVRIDGTSYGAGTEGVRVSSPQTDTITLWIGAYRASPGIGVAYTYDNVAMRIQ